MGGGTEESLLADAQQWAAAYARDVRACHSQNHGHVCTSTCVKYVKAGDGADLAADKVPKCRFLCSRTMVFKVGEGGGPGYAQIPPPGQGAGAICILCGDEWAQ